MFWSRSKACCRSPFSNRSRALAIADWVPSGSSARSSSSTAVRLSLGGAKPLNIATAPVTSPPSARALAWVASSSACCVQRALSSASPSVTMGCGGANASSWAKAIARCPASYNAAASVTARSSGLGRVNRISVPTESTANTVAAASHSQRAAGRRPRFSAPRFASSVLRSVGRTAGSSPILFRASPASRARRLSSMASGWFGS